MPKAQRYRSRFYPKDLGVYFKDASSETSVNRRVHQNLHRPKTMIYTSSSTLGLTVSSPIYPTFPGYITGMRLNVTTAPVTTLTCDLLLNGVSMFTSTDTKPTIAAGLLVGYKQIMSKAHFAVDDYLQVQLTATGTAGGPMVVILEYFSDL